MRMEPKRSMVAALLLGALCSGPAWAQAPAAAAEGLTNRPANGHWIASFDPLCDGHFGAPWALFQLEDDGSALSDFGPGRWQQVDRRVDMTFDTHLPLHFVGRMVAADTMTGRMRLKDGSGQRQCFRATRP